MWTFSNSTWKGQLKNVEDEISRPLGSREIQKTKVETVLWDTLYLRRPISSSFPIKIRLEMAMCVYFAMLMCFGYGVLGMVCYICIDCNTMYNVYKVF